MLPAEDNAVPSTSCDLIREKFEGTKSNDLGDAFYKKIHYLTFDLDLGIKAKRNFAQYPLHHVTFLGIKFEVARSNCLGGDTFTRNVTDARTHRHDGSTLIRN